MHEWMFADWLQMHEEGRYGEENLDLLWHSGLHGAWSYFKQRSQCFCRPVVTRCSRVWTFKREVRSFSFVLSYFSLTCPDKDSSDDDNLYLLRLPFSSSDPLKSLGAAIGGIEQIDFPKTISKSASSLIKKLCRSFSAMPCIHNAKVAQCSFLAFSLFNGIEKSSVRRQNHSRLLNKIMLVC